VVVVVVVVVRAGGGRGALIDAELRSAGSAARIRLSD